MLPASNKGPGMNMGFPDVCLTPAAPSPVPIPYPNMGMHAMAAPFVPTILLSMMPALNMGSMIPMTMGDEPGVANPMFKQTGMFTMGSPKVLLQGMPAITLTSMTTGNNMNNPVGMVAVPGAVNVLYTLASGAAAGGDVEAAVGDDGVAVVAPAVIRGDLPARVHALLAPGTATALVLDLRGCPGGELTAALELLRDLLPAGAPVATVVDGDGDAVVHRARGDVFGGPVLVLVDEQTASAAEVVAGALQAHARALVVGRPTYGKGVARAAVDGRMVDVARVLLPDGRALDGAGVTPDMVLPG